MLAIGWFLSIIFEYGLNKQTVFPTSKDVIRP